MSFPFPKEFIVKRKRYLQLVISQVGNSFGMK